jgi:hypothetical protein
VVAAVGSFGVVLLLVRTSHPAHASGAGTLAAPSALVAEIESPALGGGSIAAASGPAAVATSSS